ncbi:transketolase [Jatrophihabitans endophyticus]|uniref:Transketolase n=1 Tax=Jatrophihabitans endophyticus TaxID=1206085 RepID=A0A1M5CQG1_9ACTN|nr:transketolase C-terminal domain-containing protein [Jatrophihabitans endophyticus]SHF56971.1 transketolase [Jatrophihabitans endophyticus]
MTAAGTADTTDTTGAAARAGRAAREVYRDWLVARLVADQRAVCLDTDTGLFTGVDWGPAAARYVNLGIAEQCLVGTAAGLAASGYRVYANTMAAFAASRAVEMVKVDIALHGLPVRIVATHSGLSAGHLGPTHHALEDLAAMRSMPGMTVAVPADEDAVGALLDATADAPGPVYLRLGRHADPPPIAGGPAVRLGSLRELSIGSDALVVATGPLPVRFAVDAARILAQDDVRVTVVDAHTVKPFDVERLVELAAAVPLVVTVEEHWRTGGLGSLVAETLAERCPRRVVRIGVPDTFVAAVGSQQELLAASGVSAAAVVAAVRGADATGMS